MKKQNHLVHSIFVGLILCLLVTVLYTRAYSSRKDMPLEKDPQFYGDMAEELLDRRMMVINGFMYGTIDYDEAIKQLKAFEMDQCLAWDLEFVKDLKAYPTAYARVVGLGIQEVQIIETNQDRIKLTLKIKWSIKDFETNLTEEGIYEVVIGTENEEGYKLCKFDPLP